MHLRTSMGIAFGAALLLGGCAASQPPKGELGAARQALSSAEQSNAGEFAPVPLKKAREKLDRAEELADRGESDHARRLAEEAQVDAQLAEATARAERAEDAAEQARASIEALRREANPTTVR